MLRSVWKDVPLSLISPSFPSPLFNLSVSVCLRVSLSVSVSICLSVSLSLSLSGLCLRMSVCLYVCLSDSLYLYISASSSASVSVSISDYSSSSPSPLSACLSIYLSVSFSLQNPLFRPSTKSPPLNTFPNKRTDSLSSPLFTLFNAPVPSLTRQSQVSVEEEGDSNHLCNES